MKKPRIGQSIFDGGFRWGSVADVVIDAAGRTIFAGEEDDNGEFVIACFDAELKLVWIRTGLSFSDSNARLAAHPDGRILLWQEGRHSATVFDADGQDAGRIGERERPNSKLPGFDLHDAQELVVCADGTFLVVVCNRIIRYGADFVPLPTWPQNGLWRSFFPETPTPLYEHTDETRRSTISPDDDAAVYWGNRPLIVNSDEVRALARGKGVYLVSSNSGDEDVVGKVGPDGSLFWSAKVPNVDNRRPAVDGAGNVYVLASPGPKRELWIVPGDEGGRPVARRHLSDWRDGGPVIDPSVVVVSAEGAIQLWDSSGQLVLVDNEGGVRMTRAAEQEVNERRTRRQQNIEQDEDPD